MTEQEKWATTERYMRLVRANYPLICRDETGQRGSAPRRQQAARLKSWLSAIELACEKLKSKEGKSQARARHDWLVARTIEMIVREQVSDEALRLHLTGPRKLNRRYTDEMREEGLRAVKAAAEACGLLR